MPFNVEAVFGAKRVKVKVWFEGVEYRGSIVNMGGCFMLGMTKATRIATGKNPGDTVEFEIEKDEEERAVELPADFRLALEQTPAAKARYEKLSFTHKKEYFEWITGAKKPGTRAGSIVKAIEKLSE